MVIRANPKIWGPEYSCSDVSYLQKSSTESHCRRFYSPLPPPPKLGGGGEGCYRVKHNKNLQKNAMC